MFFDDLVQYELWNKDTLNGNREHVKESLCGFDDCAYWSLEVHQLMRMFRKRQSTKYTYTNLKQ